MQFKQAEIGKYRIYAGAVEAPQGGFTAAVAVEQVRGVFGGPRLIHMDDPLHGGHRFGDAASALQQALAIGRKTVYGDLALARHDGSPAPQHPTLPARRATLPRTSATLLDGAQSNVTQLNGE